MSTMTLNALKHVSAAIRHAEVLADEAADLEQHDVSGRLRERAGVLAVELEGAVAALDDVAPLRDARARCHDVLAARYHEVTLRLDGVLPSDRVLRLTPGGHLDVVERVRYRLRALPLPGTDVEPAVVEARALLETALAQYDAAVDAYLDACGDAQAKKNAVVVRSQALRVELERAKAQLLVTAEAGSEAWARIKRRAVRTKRARWLDEVRALQLFSDATG